MKYIGTSMRICVERTDKKGKKTVKIESYPDDITANSRMTVYKLFGIKSWPYFRQLKKPKKMKLPEIVEEKPEEDIIINSKENEYAAIAEGV
tara:strand:- start:1367 stop:1642 length:276 start_codon:yes stop_codon:yes gene_type:complete